jgi:ABC-type multidrug transport system fused ATPase/permease subunit
MVNEARNVYIEWRENSKIAHFKNRSVFFLLLMAIISSFTEVIGIGMFYPIFSVISQDNNKELTNSDSIVSNIPVLIFDYTGIHISLGYLLIIIVLLFLFRQLVMYIKNVYTTKVMYTVRKNLVDKMFSLFLRSSTSFHDSMSIGKFSNILSKEAHATALGIMAPIELVINIFMLSVLLLALLLVSWELTLFTVFILIIATSISKIWVSKSEKVGRDLANLNEIVKVKGIDLIYLGLFDICQSVGLPGQLDHPKVLDEIKRCGDLIRAQGISAGSMSTNIEYIKMLMNLNYNFIAYLNDAASIKFHFDDMLLQLDNSNNKLMQ